MTQTNWNIFYSLSQPHIFNDTLVGPRACSYTNTSSQALSSVFSVSFNMSTSLYQTFLTSTRMAMIRNRCRFSKISLLSYHQNAVFYCQSVYSLKISFAIILFRIIQGIYLLEVWLEPSFLETYKYWYFLKKYLLYIYILQNIYII